MNFPSTQHHRAFIRPRVSLRTLKFLTLGSLTLLGAVATGTLETRTAIAQTTSSTSSMIPAWARGQVIGSVPLRPGDKAIALTFDDGPVPGAANTEGVLSALSSQNVRGTFFMMGSAIQANPALARRVRDAGHAIGNHTWSHQAGPENPQAEVTDTDAIIQSTLGMSSTLFRPPYGNTTNGVNQQALSEGDASILWSIDPHDYNTPGTQSIVDSVVAAATPGAIVLLHDAGGDRSQTVAALPLIINALRAQGYRFVTVPELLDLRDTGITTTPVTPAPTVGDGLSATYYRNIDFTGTSVSRVDSRLAFDWGWFLQPASGIGTDTFSARWTGQIVAPTTGNYTFSLTADDGMRMWIDGKLVIDRWRTNAGERSVTLPMTAKRRTDIKVEFYENTASASIALRWSGPGISRQIVPQSVLFSRPATVAAPSLTMSAPVPQWSYKTLAKASGTVTNNGGGLPSVGALLYRYADSRYWNGSSWVTAPEGSESAASTSTSPTVSGGSTYAWNYTLPSLADGRYAMQPVARDRSGSVAPLPWTFFYVDTTPPKVAIDLPEGAYPEVRTLYGSAVDAGPGISGVGLGLMRVSDGAFWNGSAWVSSWVELPLNTYPRIDADSTLSVGWTYAMPTLSPGNYWLKAVARDYAGNAGSSNEVRFTIDPSAVARVSVAPTSNVPAASVLSSGEASATSGVRVRFRVPLHPRSLALPHYQVWVNGRALAPESARYDRASNSVILELPGAIRSGDRVAVSWNFLLAANGRRLPDGTWQGIAR